MVLGILDLMYLFQLTHSRGVRLFATLYNESTEQISTHALTWSATRSNRAA